ncbi:MAG TPA: hypothetical protein VM425_06115 [Myxococcota bacterium]|nr:hypothetical protein [Myxococcota bacterium]
MSSKTIVKHSEELKRAVRWVAERKRAEPQLRLAMLLAEAGPRFNLSPKDQDGLRLLLREMDEV